MYKTESKGYFTKTFTLMYMVWLKWLHLKACAKIHPIRTKNSREGSDELISNVMCVFSISVLNGWQRYRFQLMYFETIHLFFRHKNIFCNLITSLILKETIFFDWIIFSYYDNEKCYFETMHARKHTHTCVIYTYIHTYINTHTHTYI